MAAQGEMRPLDIRRDLDAVTDLIEIAFAGDLERWGGDFREQMKMAQRMVPLLGLLSRLSDAFRHTFDGFVWEDQGRLVSVVVVQKVGLDRTHWQIGNVATHPDYRRQGLARKLVSRAMEHTGTYGARVCTLEVRAEAQPAYELYRGLGFVHYDSITALRQDELPEVGARPLAGWSIRPMKLGEWQARYDLAVRETPQEVQAFLPVSEAEYRFSPLERLINPLATRLQRVDAHRWAVEEEGRLVGYATLVASRGPHIPHNLTLSLDPLRRDALAEPLLTLALETLQAYPRQVTRTSVRSGDAELLALLKGYGFVEIDVNHRLGARLDDGPPPG